MPVRIVSGNRQSAAPSELLLLNATAEAAALFPLLKNGHTIEMIRRLIDISASEETELRKIQAKMIVERAITHRKKILAEFERLVTRQLDRRVRQCP